MQIANHWRRTGGARKRGGSATFGGVTRPYKLEFALQVDLSEGLTFFI